MNETLGAILSGLALVLLPLLGGAIIYAVVRERIKHKISDTE